MKHVIVLGLLAFAMIGGALLAGNVDLGPPGTIPADNTSGAPSEATRAESTTTDSASPSVGGESVTPAADTSAASGVARNSTAGVEGLTQAEIQDILYMREEEKLARDVYLTLYEEWGLQVFKNIAESEQRHTDAVLSLIEKYGLEDPAVDQVGVFTNPQLQELYNQLVEMGSKNVTSALLVGALIEEKDIIDINKAISNATNPDVIMVFQNLVNGSKNHLKAFTSLYEQTTGEEYTPQLLTQEQLDQAISEARAGPGGSGGGVGHAQMGGRHG